MKYDHHHLSVGLEMVASDTFLLTLSVSGKLNHEDFDVFVPMLETVLEGVFEPKIRIFLDATEFKGWKPHAAWDDLKLGLKYGNKFDKIAIFGNKKWQELSAMVGTWFIPGEVQYFEYRGEALEWLNQ